MQENEVTAAGKTYKLEQPFFVMATQNPIEQEGTYPLPEAQLDRFMLSINIGYPTRAEEREIVNATTQARPHEVKPVLQGPDVLWIQQLVRQVPASQHMVDYAVDLARATRPKEPPSPDFVKKWLAWGAGPRAAQNMTLGAKARTILRGRYAVTADDVRAMAFPVLRHRIFTNFNADAEGIDPEQVIQKILETVPEQSYGEPVAPRGYPPAGPARRQRAPETPVAPPPPAVPGATARQASSATPAARSANPSPPPVAPAAPPGPTPPPVR
jgi:MoxR-like ATPase